MTDFQQLWQDIQHAGSIDAYVNKQLQKKGYLVKRLDAKQLSAKELARYKQQLKQEAEAIQKLNQEAWQVYKQNNIVYLGDQVYWHDNDDWDKYDRENADKALVGYQLPVIHTPAELAEQLQLTIKELRWFTYHRNAAEYSHYQQFSIPKRSGGERSIWAPKPKLKAAQRWILLNIVERMLIHGAAHGFVGGRSILTNAQQHTQSELVVKFDLADFFPSISWRRVKGIFRKVGYKEQVATLLALLCTEAPRERIEHEHKTYFIALADRCLPQGAPTSPSLTNILCKSMDRRLTAFAEKNGWRYSRYADDLTFSWSGSQSEPNIKQLIGIVHQVVKDEGLNINSKKTRILRPGSCQQITGLVVNEHAQPRVPRATKREVRAMLHNLSKGKSLHEDETLSQLQGKINFIRMVEPELGASFLTQFQQIVQSA
ncbi:retron St85 family RNA-directed DNA polymerase [Zooshikella ganghwensis]|uniref:retron St85 family RNA-directed DNA polymerase n=1 Tax=Zooshikella ganghwensis TaxID=202772 RepID=UPI0003FF7BAE|nr:retron St85 family RNA-directed DNA polymerase [Zooshikella ganghwensis]